MIEFVSRILNALDEKCDVDGCIFTDFAHRDRLTDSLLGISKEKTVTRRWIYIIEKNKSITKIVHSIESSVLDFLPGDKLIYDSHESLNEILKNFSRKTFALLIDDYISEISTVDEGFISLLRKNKIKPVSMASIIQMTKGLLSEEDILEHEKTSLILYRIVEECWSLISKCYNQNQKIKEKDVQDFILSKFKENNLITDYPPIVAFGKNTANPHYEPSDENPVLAEEGDLIQFDLWAKKEGSVYADISWVGIYDKTVPPMIAKQFEVLVAARNLVFKTISEAEDPLCITGFDLDKAVRQYVQSYGFLKNIKHRTGHGIDTECHGSGVNLDSVEFPDRRKLMNGSCFSVEPGFYFDKYGMRTEINIFIKNRKPFISGNLFSDKEDVQQTSIMTIK